jgi:acetyl esterase/lipase
MVGDAKRAVVWMKDNAEQYGVDPARVVLAGGSSGGHVALLAAYAPDQPDLTPADVGAADRSVRAAVAYYAGTDMRAFYQHFDALFGGLMKARQPGKSNFLFRMIGRITRLVMGGAAEQQGRPAFSIDWMMGNLVGGTPAEVPAAYDLASPICHVGPNCPPTLLQGEDDPFQPVDLTRALHDRLTGAGVPSALAVYPQTEPGFDLLLPGYAPAAQAALYEVDRFLALMV